MYARTCIIATVSKSKHQTRAIKQHRRNQVESQHDAQQSVKTLTKMNIYAENADNHTDIGKG